MPNRFADTIDQFLALYDWGDAQRTKIPGDASSRRYWRLNRGRERAILMEVGSEDSVQAQKFLTVGQWLLEAGYSAPRVYAADPARGLILLEDFGDALFSALIARDPGSEVLLHDLALRFLADLHRHAAPPFAQPHDGAAMGALVTLLDDYYLPALGKPALAATEIAPLISDLHDRFNDTAPVLALRDFHAGNLIRLSRRRGLRQIGLLDFQDAMAAHPAYDVVSLLQDARRDVSASAEEAGLLAYLGLSDEDPDVFRRMYSLLGVQRALRILAIFARLAIRDAKPAYLSFMPRVWGYLMKNLADHALDELAGAVKALIPEPDTLARRRIEDYAKT